MSGFFNKIIDVGNKKIGGMKTFVIAEIGSNHNQNIDTAFELIDIAKTAGADAVKFQSIKPSGLYNLNKISTEQRNILEKIKLKESWHTKISDYCEGKNIIFFSAPTDLESIDMLMKNDVKLMKIASPQTYGFPNLIEKIGETGLPTIMSTGYCRYSEMERAVDIFRKTGNKNLVLLHCVSEYPTPPSKVNLDLITSLNIMFDVLVGFSDHTMGMHIASASVIKGAVVIEKHITKSRKSEGPDHHFALEPMEFKKMIENIRDLEQAKGTSSKDKLSKFETDFREELVMRACTNQEIKKGERITPEKIKFLRDNDLSGISSWKINGMMGRVVNHHLNANEFLKWKHFNWDEDNE